MNNQFDLLQITRENVLKFSASLSLEELNTIPPHFNNNIAWNIGHLIATEQSLLYKLSSTDLIVDPVFIDKYKKGTKPEGLMDEATWTYIRKTLTETAAAARSHYEQKRFGNYTRYETSYGTVLQSIEDAIAFNNVHEGMHFGFMKAIGKAIGK